MSEKYYRIDQDEAHYVNLAGDQYIGFISKQMGQELIDEIAQKTAVLEKLKEVGVLVIRPGGGSSVTDDRRDAIKEALNLISKNHATTTEEDAFAEWFERDPRTGDVDQIHRQWMESSDRKDFVKYYANDDENN